MKFIKIWLLLVTIIFLGGLFYFTESFDSSTANGAEVNGGAEIADAAAIGGYFTLTDQHGKKISDTDFKGKLMLVYFGFTNCPGTCPIDMAMMTDALKKLGTAAKEIAPVFITVDPKRDTPKKLSKYLKNYYPSFTALTGSAKQLQAAQKEYKVYAEESNQPGMFNHSSNIYLMGRNGEYLTVFTPGTDSDTLAAGIKKYL